MSDANILHHASHNSIHHLGWDGSALRPSFGLPYTPNSNSYISFDFERISSDFITLNLCFYHLLLLNCTLTSSLIYDKVFFSRRLAIIPAIVRIKHILWRHLFWYCLNRRQKEAHTHKLNAIVYDLWQNTFCLCADKSCHCIWKQNKCTVSTLFKLISWMDLWP